MREIIDGVFTWPWGLDLDFDVLLVGDGASILTGGKERLRQLVATFV